MGIFGRDHLAGTWPSQMDQSGGFMYMILSPAGDLLKGIVGFRLRALKFKISELNRLMVKLLRANQYQPDGG